MKIFNYLLFFIKSIVLTIYFFIAFSLNAQTLPSATSTLFSGSGNCALCHIAGGGAFTTQTGADISATTLWRSTMMANSSKDPLWQAKVTAEVDAHPSLQVVIEDKCSTCHMPIGRTESIHNGADHFTLNEGFADDLSIDGVSCTLCHQIQNTDLGTDKSFTGGYSINGNHDIFGPYLSPTTVPMFNQSGYIPVYSEHVHDSELCATCHTLFTPFIDDQGKVAGTFPEQTPYLEWENSIYPSQSTECQTCHMPAEEEAMTIATRPPWLSTLRSPIWRHDFVGGNVFMGRLLKKNTNEINTTATAVQFDSTIINASRLLEEKTLNLYATTEINADTLNLNIVVENLAGHKFPTGFPSRRAWLYVNVKNNNEEIIFESGKWDSTGEISGVDEGFEPHHQVITRPDQVQIYQTIMKDVNDEVTYTLLRGAAYAKDNRLPPKGFKSTVMNYYDISIQGNAVNDYDFNRTDDGQEGSGSDRIVYKIPVKDSGTVFSVSVKMYYQTLAPRFMQDLVTHQTDKVIKFKEFYDAADKTPVLIKSISTDVIQTSIPENSGSRPNSFGMLNNYPNPFNSSTNIQYLISVQSLVNLEIFDLLGRKVYSVGSSVQEPGSKKIRWDGRDNNGDLLPSGIYVVVLTANNHKDELRILFLK